MLNALTIAILRKDDPPDEAIAMFLRLWEEESTFLLKHLSYRWLISAVATFRDFGTTESQRRVGLALALFFNMVKLYETERLYTGRRPADPHPLRDRKEYDITMNIAPFSVIRGDLDRNMLMYLWEDCAAADPVIRPLAMHLMGEFNADRRNVFRRFKEVRQRKAEADHELRLKKLIEGDD